jgi:hypothetical protein
VTRVSNPVASPLQGDAIEHVTIEQPQIKPLRPVELSLGSCGKFALSDAGWKQNVQDGAVGPAAGSPKLLAENNLLKLKVDILVEMLALANLEIDDLKSRQ